MKPVKPTRIKHMKDQSYQKGYGQHEQHLRCELCNVPIFKNPCQDERSSSLFNGKGKILCNKCLLILTKMPAEQALQALNNASETYPKEK